MGEEQRGTWQDVLTNARAAFEDGTDFTLAVEEEFALLDPESLDLVDRFEELYAAAQLTDLQPNVVGELIASEIEVRTGRCEDFTQAAAAMAERRTQLQALARDAGLALGATGTHPWARWQDQRIIDTPHYRRNDELLRYVVWRNNTFGLHVHVGIAGADRAIAVHNAHAQLPARAARALCQLAAGRERQLWFTLGPHRDFHAHVPALRHSRRLRRLDRIRRLHRVPLSHRFDDRAHTALVERAPASRVPDDRDPDQRRAARSGRVAVARGAHLRARRALRRAPTTRASRCRTCPNRLLEENLWRAIRYGLSGELIDFAAGEALPARARIEQLIEWVAPVADEIGAAPFLAVPERNAAERQIARLDEGASLAEIYAEQVGNGATVSG